MIKVLDNTINYVNHNHRRKGLNNYQIKIENKNKYVNKLIEDKNKEEEYRLYSNFLSSSLPPHKCGYTPRKPANKQ